MAQRMLSCGNCSGQFAVPDDYFRANIQCPHCGAVVDRRTGATAQAVSGPPQPAAFPAGPQPARTQGPIPYPAGPQPYPAQARAPYPAGPQPFPPQFAAYPGQYAPYPPRRGSRTGLIIGLVVGGVFAACVIGVVVLGALMSTSVDAGGPWYHYVSEQGNFEVDLPEQPTIVTEPSEPGTIGGPFHRAYFETWGTTFEASYFDLGTEHESYYEYDYNEAADLMAGEFGGRVTARENRKVGAYEGMVVKVKDSFDLCGTYLLLRVGNRVYVVGADNHEPEQQAAADRVINSFKLRKPPEVRDPMRAYRTVGNTWTQRTTVTGGFHHVSHMRWEVLSVSGSQVTTRMTMFDENMKETYSNESSMDLDVKPAPGNFSAPKPNLKREKISVPAGEFDCDLFESGDMRLWTCRKSGVAVKSEGAAALTELIEFKVK